MSAAGQRRAISGPAPMVVTMMLGLVHALVVAPRYRVGSFDDDAAYVLAGRALASGAGFTTRLSAGYPLVGVYPPGYPAILAPLAAIWPHRVVPFRVLSLALFGAIFPLTWTYLGRRGVGQPARLVVLALLALSPVLATYATMVMPEVPFVVVALVLLLVVERWESQPGTVTWSGAGTLAAAGALLWLKEAGVGLVIGVAVWLVFRRLWRKAALVAVGPLLLFLPVVAARASAGVALIGSRYSSDLGATTGGFVARAGQVAPHALWGYLSLALPRSIIPTDVSPLPVNGPISGLLAVVQWTAAPLVVLGFVAWVRRHRDVAAVAVPLYLIETLLYPFTNERRVILVLPVVMAWYVLGLVAVFATLRRLTGAAGAPIRSVRVGGAVTAATLTLIALVAQFPRDYLFSVGQDSSSPGGSPYLAFLRGAGRPGDVVETDFLWTTALYSGHRTANAAYQAPCDGTSIARALGADRAGYLLTAALTGPIVDNGCVLDLVGAGPGAIRLYRTGRDRASVFELVGPGTPHPDLSDLTSQARVGASGGVTDLAEPQQNDADRAGRYLSVATTDGVATITWSWPQPQAMAQISLGAAGAESGTTTAVVVEVLATDGGWRPVARVAGPVGPSAPTPFLLDPLARPLAATAVRVTVTVGGHAGAVAVHDVNVLGSAPGG